MESLYEAKKNKCYVPGDMAKKIRVGRQEQNFIIFLNLVSGKKVVLHKILCSVIIIRNVKDSHKNTLGKIHFH